MRRVGPWPLGRAKDAVARPRASETVRLNDINDSPSLVTVPSRLPCQYRTGKTLRSTTHGILKEAVHIKTGKYYACKVINKKLSEGRKFMVRNELAVLKRVSSGHRNIVTLHDCFETEKNLYLVFDLCSGGELFDRICAKGNYHEPDAADLVRTIMKAVQYIHDSGIVHRNLKPENMLFRTPAEDADVMIDDFGLSHIMEEDIQEKYRLPTEFYGTPGYMAPEIFKRKGYGKPADIWAMGVTTYFLLAGHRPFDGEHKQLEIQAIITGDYKFEPEEYWANVSQTAKEFVTMCLTVDPTQRPTASELLKHRWLVDEKEHYVPDPGNLTSGPTNLLPHIPKRLGARTRFRRAVWVIIAINRWRALGSLANPGPGELQVTVDKYKESEKEDIDEDHEGVHQHNQGDEADGIAQHLGSSRPVASKLRTVLFPRDCSNRFASMASMNTARNRETCGLLLGKYKAGRYVVTTLLIPKQHSTGDTCAIDEEELVVQFTERRSLIILGWIHIHPTQPCFMSSIDLHMHSGFQRILPESFAVVCAPNSTPNLGIFRLSDPPGLRMITECQATEAFHLHPEQQIYTDAAAGKGHVQISDIPIEIDDLREDTALLRKPFSLLSEDTLEFYKGSLSRYRHSEAGHIGEEGEELTDVSRMAGEREENMSEPGTPKQRTAALPPSKPPAERGNVSPKSKNKTPSASDGDGLALPTDTPAQLEVEPNWTAGGPSTLTLRHVTSTKAEANPTPEGPDMLRCTPESQLHGQQLDYLRILQDKFGTTGPDRSDIYSCTDDASASNEGDGSYRESFVEPDNESYNVRCSVKTMSKSSFSSSSSSSASSASGQVTSI